MVFKMGGFSSPRSVEKDLDQGWPTLGYRIGDQLYVDARDGTPVPVARLVLSTFVPSPGNNNNLGTVCWRDGNKCNNQITNLYWDPEGPGWV